MEATELELWPAADDEPLDVVREVAKTIAVLIGLEMMARNWKPAPGVAVEMAIDEYVGCFLPLVDWKRERGE